jgi:glutathione S-transferase
VQSPVIVVTEGAQTVTVAESATIVGFLIERYSKDGALSVPASSADLQARANYSYWVDAAEGSFMLPMMLSIVFGKVRLLPLFRRLEE